MIHKPVLAKEIVEMLNPQPGEFFIDGTLGAGGHTTLLAERVGAKGKVLALDVDQKAIQTFVENHSKNIATNIQLRNDNFAHIAKILAQEKLGKADGLLLDLGLSSDQLESSGRGFSFQGNEPLLMTFSDSQTPLRTLLRTMCVEDIEKILREWGDERYASEIAQEIKAAVHHNAMETTDDLKSAVARGVPKNYEHGRIHPATRTFLALRIYTNNEYENLSNVLQQLGEIIKVGGRVAVITFHSGEDRLVKNIFRDMAKSRILALANKKVITASVGELRANPRSRSAKLRAVTIGASEKSRRNKYGVRGLLVNSSKGPERLAISLVGQGLRGESDLR